VVLTGPMSDMGPGIQLQICLSSPSPT